jgi:TonB family protein
MSAFRFLPIVVVALSLSSAAFAAEKTTAIWSDGHTSALSDEELVRYAITSPGPGYPQEAQRTKAAGSGVYELRLDKAGVPKTVVIVKSSGSVVLDKAATTTFQKWRFKPGIFTSVRVPVAWSVNPVRN